MGTLGVHYSRAPSSRGPFKRRLLAMGEMGGEGVQRTHRSRSKGYFSHKAPQLHGFPVAAPLPHLPKTSRATP